MQPESGDLLRRAHRSRGHSFGVHEILSTVDPEFMRHYQEWIEFTYVKERHLDRKTKELIVTAIDIVRQSAPEHVKGHLLAAARAGATQEELLELCTMMAAHGGPVSLLLAMEGWRQAFRPDLPSAYELRTTEP